eukprot:TRINITY_DN28093_c0_g1_i1.p1 TRINITY_DN28093_c0_g1~~TRINITY_DN28093_c0_g1_i1.p1  ORF type:complete len:921 (+),score=210.89 TRINITY_DN28093_c0_g1_i1:145-2907(+)
MSGARAAFEKWLYASTTARVLEFLHGWWDVLVQAHMAHDPQGKTFGRAFLEAVHVFNQAAAEVLCGVDMGRKIDALLARFGGEAVDTHAKRKAFFFMTTLHVLNICWRLREAQHDVASHADAHALPRALGPPHRHPKFDAINAVGVDRLFTLAEGNRIAVAYVHALGKAPNIYDGVAPLAQGGGKEVLTVITPFLQTSTAPVAEAASPVPRIGPKRATSPHGAAGAHPTGAVNARMYVNVQKKLRNTQSRPTTPVEGRPDRDRSPSLAGDGAAPNFGPWHADAAPPADLSPLAAHGQRPPSRPTSATASSRAKRRAPIRVPMSVMSSAFSKGPLSPAHSNASGGGSGASSPVAMEAVQLECEAVLRSPMDVFADLAASREEAAAADHAAAHENARRRTGSAASHASAAAAPLLPEPDPAPQSRPLSRSQSGAAAGGARRDSSFPAPARANTFTGPPRPTTPKLATDAPENIYLHGERAPLCDVFLGIEVERGPLEAAAAAAAVSGDEGGSGNDAADAPCIGPVAVGMSRPGSARRLEDDDRGGSPARTARGAVAKDPHAVQSLEAKRFWTDAAYYTMPKDQPSYLDFGETRKALSRPGSAALSRPGSAALSRPGSAQLGSRPGSAMSRVSRPTSAKAGAAAAAAPPPLVPADIPLAITAEVGSVAPGSGGLPAAVPPSLAYLVRRQEQEQRQALEHSWQRRVRQLVKKFAAAAALLREAQARAKSGARARGGGAEDTPSWWKRNHKMVEEVVRGSYDMSAVDTLRLKAARYPKLKDVGEVARTHNFTAAEGRAGGAAALRLPPRRGDILHVHTLNLKGREPRRGSYAQTLPLNESLGMTTPAAARFETVAETSPASIAAGTPLAVALPFGRPQSAPGGGAQRRGLPAPLSRPGSRPGSANASTGRTPPPVHLVMGPTEIP